MLYFIQPQEDQNKVFDENKNEVTEFTIQPSGNSFRFEVGDFKKIIKPYHFRIAKEEGSYIKVDSAASKVKRVAVIGNVSKKAGPVSAVNLEVVPDIKIKTMDKYSFDKGLFIPMKTGSVLDEFFSTEGGILPAVKIMVNGEPGTMKSSNLYQLLQDTVAYDNTKKVCYISAEMGPLDAKRSITKWYPGAESTVHMAFPGEYLGGRNPDEPGITATQYILATLKQGWDLVVVDSLKIIQKMIRFEMEFKSDDMTEQWILNSFDEHCKFAKNEEGKHTSFLIIQQSNKSGSISGSATLEYMINGTILMQNDKKERGQRYMVFKKNRSGKSKMRLYYDPIKGKGIVYNEAKYRAELEFADILSGANIGEDEEQLTGTKLAELIQHASDTKAVAEGNDKPVYSEDVSSEEE